MNRAWKCLLFGLTQEESLSRYLAISALKKVLPVIGETLLDFTIFEDLLRALIVIMNSDERVQNRIRAIHLSKTLFINY